MHTLTRGHVCCRRSFSLSGNHGGSHRGAAAAAPAAALHDAKGDADAAAKVEMVRRRVGKLNAKKSKRRFSGIKFSFGRSSRKVPKKKLVGSQSSLRTALSPSRKVLSPSRTAAGKGKLSPRKALSPRRATRLSPPKLAVAEDQNLAPADDETIVIRSPKPSPENIKRLAERETANIPPIARTLAMYSIDRAQLKSVKVKKAVPCARCC